MAVIAFGAAMTWGGAGVGSLTNINGLEITVDSIDATTHSSADGFREFLPGMAAVGDISVEGYFDKSDTDGQHTMVTDAAAKTEKEVIIQFDTVKKISWTFDGFITSVKVGDADLEGNIKFSATIKPTGKPTFAIALA